MVGSCASSGNAMVLFYCQATLARGSATNGIVIFLARALSRRKLAMFLTLTLLVRGRLSSEPESTLLPDEQLNGGRSVIHHPEVSEMACSSGWSSNLVARSSKRLSSSTYCEFRRGRLLTCQEAR